MTTPAVLPAAEWTQREDLARLVRALGADNLRWVGGAVRDTLIGSEVADVDGATLLVPDKVMERLEAAGIKSVPTGIAHGTVTAVLPGGNVEVTTLRRDVTTDGRRATIAFADDWQEDAARRDFTINALYVEPATLVLHDYFDGLADLAARRLRFIGDAEMRIREDHLRILRYYRFQARFGAGGAPLDGEAEQACARLAPMLKGLSRERVASELLGLLSLPDPTRTLARMAARGVLAIVLPETGAAGLDALARLIAVETRTATPPCSIRRLAALLPADPAVAEGVAARLRLSVAARKRLAILANRDAGGSDARALAYHIGWRNARDALLLAGRDLAPLDTWEPPAFPLKGGAIVARGIAAGPEVSRILQTVERRWIEEGFPSTDRVDVLADEELTAALRSRTSTQPQHAKP